MHRYAKERAIVELRLIAMIKKREKGRVISRNGNASVDYTKGNTYVWFNRFNGGIIFTQNPRKDYRRSDYTFIGELYNCQWLSTREYGDINYLQHDLKSPHGFRHREGYGWE